MVAVTVLVLVVLVVVVVFVMEVVFVVVVAWLEFVSVNCIVSRTSLATLCSSADEPLC